MQTFELKPINGKKSFGKSGLSANLKEMEKGIQKNILEMYKTKRIRLAKDEDDLAKVL